MRRGFKAWAERRSLELQTKIRLAPIAPLSAKQLADQLGGRIMAPAELPGMTPAVLEEVLFGSTGAWSALTVGNRNGILLLLHNPTHSLGRQESNLMH